jgi:hypothetical protein
VDRYVNNHVPAVDIPAKSATRLWTANLHFPGKTPMRYPNAAIACGNSPAKKILMQSGKPSGQMARRSPATPIRYVCYHT